MSTASQHSEGMLLSLAIKMLVVSSLNIRSIKTQQIEGTVLPLFARGADEQDAEGA